jgi:hypothetical protein
MYVRQKLSGGKPDKGFDVADFPTLGDEVTKVIALGPGGDPKVPGATTATTTPKAKTTTTTKGKSSSGTTTSTTAAGGG